MAKVNSFRRVTIREVAAQAGVSTQTVSRVVNGHPDVSDETRIRVQQVIAQLRYRPSGVARSLAARSSQMLGVVAGGFHLFGPVQLLTGIEQQATDLGWHLMLQIVDSANPQDYERVAANLISQNVAGVIWAYPELTGECERAFLQQVRSYAPVVFLSMEPCAGSAVINVDNRHGARLAAEHLIARGYRHIGIITGPLTLWSAQQRKLGWQDALASAELPRHKRQIVEGDWTAAGGDAGLVKLLTQFPTLDAVFVSNDQMALGALKAAERLGRRVPDDLGIVGFDDIPESGFFKPSLTTVHHDLIELGRIGVRELHRVIQLHHEGRPASTTSLVLQPWLVVRESA
ncbi:MAG: LacI family DNA-binding transcriptional regulator [Anaerolineae bacterium]|nr:LacI family transcriptional regulator [Thermoflexales bacterium]MDW8408582.1 LacI family DNA-binding transcriptional regulator [Anaerolineae bacterium]